MLERWATAALLHVFVAGLASGALAQAKHFDIAVQENATDGRPSVHGFNFNTGAALRFMTDLRVFNESFGVSGNSFFTDAPGFVSRISSAELDPVGLLSVPPGQPLRFNLLAAPSLLPELGGRNLSYWDGTGPVVWSDVPGDEEIKVFAGSPANPTDEATVDGSTTDVPGFIIAASNPISGSLHTHIQFLLRPPKVPDPGPGRGVYLMLFELAYPTYAEWVPAWVMFKAEAGGQSTLDTAVTYVRDNFQRALCDDGIDNDKDGLSDMDDPGCASFSDMSERGDDECDDGIDNDGDGRTDFDPDTFADAPSFTAGTGDPGCKQPNWSFGEAPGCNDGLNNDEDAEGTIDHDGGAAASAAGLLCLAAGTPMDCCTGLGTGCDGLPDPQCVDRPWRNNEASSSNNCGLGAELALVLAPLFHLLRGRRRRGLSRLGDWRRPS